MTGGLVPPPGKDSPMSNPEPLPLAQRLVFSIPVLGWMLKDVFYGDRDNIFYFLFSLVAIWVLAIWFIGYAAFIFPVLAMVPTIFVILLMITRG